MFWFRSRQFWKVLGAYALLSAVALGILVVSLRNVLESNTREALEGDVRHQVALMRESFSHGDTAVLFDRWRTGLQMRGQQLVLCDLQGKPLAREPQTSSTEVFSDSLLRSLSLSVGNLPAVRWSPDRNRWLYGFLKVESPSGEPRLLILASDVRSRMSQTETNGNWAVRVAVISWICGTACLAMLAIAFLRPFRMLMKVIQSRDEEPRRRDLLIRLSDRRDEFGQVARFVDSLDRERREKLHDVRLQEQSMRSSTTQLSAMLEAMVEGVIAVDEQQRILFANNVACRLFGLDRSTVEGRRIFEILRINHVQEAVDESLKKGESVAVEFRQPRTEARVALVVSPIVDQGGAVLVFDDVTEVRRLESMRRDFVSGVGHELKTPLTVIQACTETLLDGAVDDPGAARRFLIQIEEQSERLLELILGMLQLSRLESGQQVFESLPVDLREVAERVVSSVRTIADGKQISLTIEGEPELFVLGDYQAIRTILGNLVDNAIKYTPEKGAVRVELIAETNVHVARVVDNGLGIPEKDQHRVFERFYRVDADRNRERGGTGLGLAIVKHLCQAMNAEVSLKSRTNVGSSIEVRFHLDAPLDDSSGGSD